MANRVELKRGWFGRYAVGYDCPRCKARLTSSLKDVGMSDVCPDCSMPFVVPGDEQKALLLAQERRDDQERRHREAAERAKRDGEACERREEEQRVQRASLREDDRAKKNILVEPDISTQSKTQQAAQPQLTKRCPYCAEEIHIEAQKCKHCGEFLTQSLRAQNSHMPPKERGGCGQITIIAFGIVFGVLLLMLL